MAISHNLTSAAYRIQAVSRAMAVLFSFCSILRYRFPALYSDPLCGMKRADLTVAQGPSLGIVNAITDLYAVQQAQVNYVTIVHACWRWPWSWHKICETAVLFTPPPTIVELLLSKCKLSTATSLAS